MQEYLGDATPLGVLTTAAYALGSALVAAAALRAPAGPTRRALALAAALLGVLGLNKQLDLQHWVYVGGRWATVELGMYRYRDQLHLGLTAAVALGGVAAIVLARRVLAGETARLAPVLAGFAAIGAYVVLRVAFFSHLGEILGWSFVETGGIAALELAGIALVTWGARYAQRSPACFPAESISRRDALLQ